MSLSRKVGSGNTVTDLQLEQARDLLARETGMPWVVNGNELAVTYKESTKIFFEKMGSVMEGRSVKIFAEAKVVNATIRDPNAIVFLAEKLRRVYGTHATTLSAQIKKTKEELFKPEGLPPAPPPKKEPARTSPPPQASSSTEQAPPLPAAEPFTVEQANELVRTLTPETARQLVGEMTEEQKAGLLTAFLQVQTGGLAHVALRTLYKYLETSTGERGGPLSGIDMKKARGGFSAVVQFFCRGPFSGIDMKKAREGFSTVVQQYVLNPEVKVPKVQGDDATKMEMFLAYIVIARKLVMAKSFKGTKSKFLNALVGPVLHQVTNPDLFREAALRSPEVTPGEHLERWRDTTTHDIDAKQKVIPFLLFPRETPPGLENVEVRPVRVAGGDTVVSLAHARGDRKIQEDTHAVGSFTVGGQPVGYYGIFDGHGGGATSHFLQEEIQKIMEEEFALLGKPLEVATNAEIENILSVVTVKAHAELLEKPSDGSGATFSLALVIKNNEGDAVWAVNAGDGRILALQDDAEETSTVQLTEDASPTKDRFKRGVERRGGTVIYGRVGEELAVARAIGDAGVLGMTSRAKVTRFPLSETALTILIIGCDGLFECDSSHKIADTLREIPDYAEHQAEYLIQRAYRGGSGDNISAMVVHIPVGLRQTLAPRGFFSFLSQLFV